MVNHLLHAIVKKGQTGVLVADEGALLDEADENLGLGELGVKLLVGSVSAFEKPCRKERRGEAGWKPVFLYPLRTKRKTQHLCLTLLLCLPSLGDPSQSINMRPFLKTVKTRELKALSKIGL